MPNPSSFIPIPSSISLIWEGGAGDWALAGAVLLLAAFTLWHSPAIPRVLAVLRVAAFACLAFFAAKPALMVYGLRAERPKVAVLLDVSRGMATVRDGVSDIARAQREVKSLKKSLESAAEVQLYRIGQRAVRIGWESLDKAPPGGPLDIGQSLEDVWRENGETLDAVWLFSDGVGDRSRDLNAAISRLGCPIYVVGAGSLKAKKGLRIDQVRSPEFAFLHLPFPLQFSWTARGMRGVPVAVRVLHAGKAIASARFTPSQDFEAGSSSLSVVSPALGTQSFELEFSPEAGPASSRISQTRPFSLETVRQKLRILYLAGHPSFEYSALRHFLKSNPNFELVSFVILRNPENIIPFSESELSLIPFPAHEIFVTTLNQFDLFILEDFSYTKFQLPMAYLGYVRQFVERGGGLLLIGGNTGFARGGYRGSPLEGLLPVELLDTDDEWIPGAYQPRVPNPAHPLLDMEGDAAASARLWSTLPPLDGMNRFKSVRPGSTVLLSHPQIRLPSGGLHPVLSGRDLGRGKILLMASPSTWRWKLGAALRPELGSFYEAFWQRCIQYLTGSLELSKLRLAPLARTPAAGEDFSVWMHVLDETFSPLSDPKLALEVRLRGKGMERTFETREMRPGVYQSDIPGLEAGSYEIMSSARYLGKPWGSDARTILVREVTEGETFNRLFLEELARKGRGAYADLEAVPAKEWLEAMPERKEARSIREHWTVWASSGWLWTALALLFAEWFLRRRKGYL